MKTNHENELSDAINNFILTFAKELKIDKFVEWLTKKLAK